MEYLFILAAVVVMLGMLHTIYESYQHRPMTKTACYRRICGHQG